MVKQLEEVTVKLLTDNYAAETYMEITDENGLIVWSEGNENVGTNYNTFDGTTPIDYTNPLENNQNYEWLVTLPATGCLKFTIYDYYGDGLNAAQWSGTDGNWSIENHNNTLMEEQSSQDFGGFDEAFFTNSNSPNCSDLFFSEYVEGSSFNRALEIYNPTSNTVDLSNYTIERYANGSALASDVMNLYGNLLPGQTWIITNSDTNWVSDLGVISMDLYNLADQTAPPYPSPLYFNGNDALTLSKNGVVIDVFGKIGENPGRWVGLMMLLLDLQDANGGQLWTQNSTLVRQSNVLFGNTNNPSSFNPSEQWTLFPNNTFSNLGFHECDCNNNFSKTYIPDDNFEQYLIESGYDDILDDSVLTINISDITSLYVSSREISDLTGIQAMPNLTFLACDNNNLSEIDVSQNINLQTLWIGGNNLTEIDITQNTALSSFVIWENELTELDVTQNDSLTYLDCSNNNITEIDVTQNINLTTLYAYGIMKLPK